MVHVRFWGTRGSIPTPGPTTVRYGGNTACIELRSSAGTLAVLDCGTGARALGRHLVSEAARAGTAVDGALLIGHTHWDHIHGLPFFAPLQDDRFADNPAVRQEPRARFYAGAPLQLPDGSRVGTLCVIDHRPRVLDDGQLEQLRTLAALVELDLAGAPGP